MVMLFEILKAPFIVLIKMLLLFIQRTYVYTKNLFSCFFPFNFSTLQISEIELEKNVHRAAQVILENRVFELQQENQKKQAEQAILENRIHELQQENQKKQDEQVILENRVHEFQQENEKLIYEKAELELENAMLIAAQKALENKIATDADANLKRTVAKMIEEIKENCTEALGFERPVCKKILPMVPGTSDKGTLIALINLKKKE
ncbi:9206_t:CDS:2 [Diversispora eburnea]|uniref:9206_t:CDS:1 n=1 Tax=Diversispora eburnea TaxID=1213867 RepID=A0A9N9ALG9_9GLOM|nr:9206_t:CDS:2 [Diversispora eburnea]